jgi:arginyl-tRNA synthetase
MSLAKQLKQKPRDVAEQIRAKADLGGMAEKVEIAGPGFLNVYLSPEWVNRRLNEIAQDDRLGVERVTDPQTVVVDYSGPNIAKEMHVGHLRSTIIGDAFARLLAFVGHRVIRQNHVGDWGLQMGMVTFAMEQEDGLNRDLTLADLERLYKKISKSSEDPAVRRKMAERTKALQQTPKDELLAWQKVRAMTLASAQQMYGRLNVLLTEAEVRGESFYSDRYEPLVNDLLAKGVARETDGAIGVFPPGFTNREGEPRPFIVRSRDGSYQYPTFDLAALTYRVTELGAERIIYTHDDRQAEHFAMLFAVAKLMGLDQHEGRARTFEYAPFGTVLGEDNKPLKSRSGENIKLAELLDEAETRAAAVVAEKNPELPSEQQKTIAHAVGIGAVKYADLSKDRTSDYVFSWDTMLAMEGNTGPYLQYAYARVCSIFRRAGVTPSASMPIKLEAPEEFAIAKQILRLPEVIDHVARELRPHLLSAYLYELATRFSAFFERCPVIKTEEPTRSSRLALCALTARTLALGLDLLGIEHPEQL